VKIGVEVSVRNAGGFAQPGRKLRLVQVLNTFALTLIIGIIVGTYSSIYVAASIVVIWKNFQNRRKLAVVPAPAPVKAPAVPPTAPTPSASASSAAVARPAGSGKKKKNRR